MPERHERLLNALTQEYRQAYAPSGAAHERASRVLVDGISHGARTHNPFPLRIRAAQGAHITEVGGRRLLDYWQGHYANILGHNPPEVTQGLVAMLQAGYGLQTGLPEEREAEYAELLAQTTGADQVRLTTSGTLATMYALMVARAYTGRKLVLKVGGGWHGANPLALKGVAHSDGGYDRIDSAGISSSADQEILVTRFNDVEALELVFALYGDQIAAFIFEPCPSIAGFIPSSPAYMQAARRLTAQHGALLILDEVITGFRYCASGAQRLYGVQADLTTYGKIIGGGMPIAAVAGRADLMALIREGASPRVWFNGGTYSAHPLSVLGALLMLRYLVAHEDEVYPALAAQGERLRQGIEEAMAAEGVLARCTGRGNAAVQGSSLSTVYFPLQEDLAPQGPEALHDPRLCDLTLAEPVLKIGLLLQGVNVVHGLGALSMAHTEADLERTWAAFGALAQRIRAGA
jgi:glutamate-1-semialdehyde 2,1-aminomutase